jgi:hypothetical protein
VPGADHGLAVFFAEAVSPEGHSLMRGALAEFAGILETHGAVPSDVGHAEIGSPTMVLELPN